MLQRTLKKTVVLALLTGFAHAQAADVTVKDAWARATVAGQQASGAFMTVTSAKGATLVGASSPAAKTVEIHEMKSEGDVMKMRPVAKVDLPAGKAVDLSGDYHVMLMGLKKPLAKGDSVPLTLKVETAAGKTETIKVKAEVRDLTSGKAATGDHAGHHHHH